MYDSIQDLRAFSDKVYDLIADHLKYDEVSGGEGVYVDENLEVSIIKESEAKEADRFYPIQKLLREEDGNIEPDGEEIDDIASQYFFVR